GKKDEVFSICAITDSITKNVKIEPTLPLFYPRLIYLNLADATGKYYRYIPEKKGELHLHLSLPHVNSFQMSPKDESEKINTGFWGLAIGLDYYHLEKQFINFRFSGVMDFFIPVPAAVDIGGEHETLSSLYISLSNNHKLGRFSIGYGLSYARNNWNFSYEDWGNPPPPTRDPVTKNHYTFGLVFPTYFQFRHWLNIGVVYRPTFYRPNMTDKFLYEHLISIDFACKLKLKK
ncbi:MAG: hypothetical protein LBI49_09790, partial [Nocardiopsaceae bacterium]|nr:hypothetical protein [Nocardiopsaceae bacterium]